MRGGPSALSLIAQGRLIVQKRAPYYSALLYSLIPVAVPPDQLETACITKGLVLGYNPVWIESLNAEQVAGLLAHELNHPLRHHHERIRAHEDIETAGRAADIPINDDLRKAGFSLPPNGLSSALYGFPAGLTMEEYYILLKKLPPGKRKGAGGGATGGGCGVGEESDLHKELDKKYGRTQTDVAIKRKQTASDIQSSKAGGRGSMSSDLTEAVAAALAPPKIAWSHKLRQAYARNVNQIAMGRADYSMRRLAPSTYLHNDGILRPGLIAYKPNIMICVDTSASMSNSVLSQVFREGIAVIQSAGVGTIWYMEADADVAKAPQRVSAAQLMHMPVHGRGGTNFDPAIQLVRKLRPAPEILLYFTDGDGQLSVPAPKRTRVIWCIFTHLGHYQRPPWGEVILIGKDGELVEAA